MVASGVGQYSMDIKSNLKDFYGDILKTKKSLKELTDKKIRLEADSTELDQLRDKGQRIAAQMRELRQQKTEIKLGNTDIKNTDLALRMIDRQIAKLNRDKLDVEAEIQPIRTANAELYKVDKEIDRINNSRVDIKFSDSVKNFGDSMNKMGDGILKKFNPLTSKLNQMFGFGLITKGIDSVTNMVNGSVDSAIKRVDTLNNYTKVMSNLGVNEKDALSSKQDLVKGLQGLPTALDDGVSAVQRFTSTNSDVGKSTKMFLALNNALLAGGGSADIQSSALEQLSQAYSKGKPELEEFRAMQTAMPGQLKQVATSMGMSVNELQQAMTGQNATVSMDQLMDKIMELNEKGSKGFSSFADQAKNATGGVQTGIANMHTAVTRGVAGLINSLDKMLKDAKLGGISGVLGNIGSEIEKGLGSIGELVEKNKEPILKFFNSLSKTLSSIFEAMKKFDYSSFFNGLGKGFKSLKDDGMVVIKFAKPLFDLISGSLGNKNTAETLGKLIPRLFEFGIALKAVGMATKVTGTVGGFIGKLSKFNLPKFPSFGGKTKGEELPLKNISINDFKSLGLKMLTIAGISANIYLAAKALEEVQNVGDLGSLQPKMLAIAEAVTGMGVLVFAAGKLMDSKTAVTGILTVAGIAGDIFIMAKALEEVNNINSDFGSIQAKIGQIALCVVEIGALSAVVGALMDTGAGAIVLASGLAAILAIAGTLYLTGQAVASISSLEIDSEKISTNIGAIKETITALGTLGFDSSVFDALGELLNSLINLGIMASVVGIGHEIEELQSIVLVPETIGTNIGAIKTTLTMLNELGFEGSVFEQLGELLNSFMKLGIVGNIVNIGGQLSKLQELDLDQKKVTDTINTIKSVINLVSGGDDGGLFSKLGKLIDGALDADDFALANEKFKAINAIGSTLQELQKKSLDQKAINANITIIRDAINSISNFATDDIVNNLGGMAEALATITEEITKNYPPEYADLGKLLATKMNEGFKSNLNFKKAVSERMNEINKDMARGKGSDLANGLNSGFDSTLKLSEKIKNQINEAMNQDYKTSVTVDVIKNEVTKKAKKSGKGNNAHGGLMTNPHGTEIIDSPEHPVLDNGEYVIPKKIVKALGTPFFNQLRSGQISRTFAGLGQKVSHTTSNVVNNIYNNTTNQNMNVYPGPRQDVMFIANRRIRV